ncbi:MarR family transcriptional regulator [Ramlibacter henchirensis]|uniref:MarR family transcriptional regulator n=1 Tax=Ramlibacter henchirensis TaxID=204072 RepID=A0A4Z0BWW5_9BURK|nr:helix-turn-helix domain-containing protein [Ramlibacter henchirensis]TFZ02748.1 MarR family transcriptional regulator [Ramlibacter henchirensis]
MDMPTGTQSLSRSIRLLRVLATRGEIGWRLSDLAVACELDKSTAHRMLAALLKERLVQQRAGDRRYLPGPLLYELGLSVHGQHAFQAAAQARLAPWARRMEASALLLLRSGFEYVCSVRVGPARLPGLMVEQGTRRPLFTSVGGVAILQTLPAEEAREVLANNIEQEVAKRGEGRLEALQRMRQESARHGFGVNLGDVVSGVHAFAVPIAGPDASAFAALCLIGTAERFPASRVDEIRDELTRMAGELRKDAAALLWHGAEP